MHQKMMKQDHEAYLKKEQDFLDNYNMDASALTSTNKQLTQSFDDPAKSPAKQIKKDGKLSDPNSPQQ